MRENILNIEDLSIWYRTYRGYSKVVDHINLQVGKGEKIGLVGESGCGKTTTMKTVMGVLGKDLIHVPDGKIDFAGKNVLEMKQSELLQLRRTGISMISQSPMSALNPVFTIGQQLTDIIKYSGLYKKNDKKAITEAAHQALTSVMLSDPDRIMASYPHQLSGGMRQRVMIAAALTTEPRLLIADEPTTALDVTIQAQILKLMKKINEKHGTGILFISHDLGVIRKLCSRVIVMNQGEIVEEGPVSQVFEKPQEEYTKKLLAAIPTRRTSLRRRKGGNHT